MPIDTLEARFAVDKGVIRTEVAKAVTGTRAINAEGVINLPTHRLDMELAIDDAAQANAADADAPRSRDVVDMHGPWTAPDLESGTANP